MPRDILWTSGALGISGFRDRAVITEPAATRAIAVGTRQALRLEADLVTNWWVQTNGGAFSQINGPLTSVLVWETPATVNRRFTFDQLQVIAQATQPSPTATGGLLLNLCEGPPTVLLATSAIRNEAMEEPPARPDDAEHDDPPLGTPFVMPAANRDRVGTVLLESPAEPGGPANLVLLSGPGASNDTAGKLGARTSFVPPARGLGPFPAVASFCHTGFYFHHDFGRSRTLGLVRVLYRESNDVAIVRGDGRRNTYRDNAGAFVGAASLQNTLTSPGANLYKEVTPSGTEYYYEYNGGRALGLLRTVVDRYGNPIYYLYDTNTRLQKVQGLAGSSGLVPYLAYDAGGLCSALVLEDAAAAANNRTTYFHYDANKNLVKIIGPELCITYFEYNDPEALSAITDPEGFRWYFAYDAGKRVERVIDPLGNASYLAYDASTSPLTTLKDRASKATYFQYNAFGSPTRVLNVGTPTDYYTYDGEGNLKTSKNRLAQQWTYEYDSRGNRIAVNDPLGARSYFAYDAQDLLRKAIDPLGRSTYLDYDASRNRTATVDPLDKTTYYAYRSSGLLHFKKDRRTNFTYWSFDAKANNDAVVDALGQITYFEYNSAGERTKTFDARQNATYFTYDKRGRVTEAKDAYLSTRLFAYDARCNLVTEVDQRSKSTYHTYDGNSNRTKTVRDMGGGDYLATYFRYDPEERLQGQKNARLNETYWTYDTLGRRDKQIDPLGFTTYWEYDDAHEVTKQRDQLLSTTYFAYDETGRQQKVKDAYLNETYMGYDLKGNSVLSTDQIGLPTYYLYDQLDRRIKGTDAYGNFDYYVFDEESNLTRSVNKRGFATYYTYDALNRRTHEKDPVHFAETYHGYDAVGNRVLGVDARSFATYFTYDRLNRQEGSIDQGQARMYYAYDPASNRVENRVEQGWGRQPWGSSPYGGERRSTYYEYDAANRIVKMIDPEAAAGAARGFMYYEYDRVGNRTKSVDQEGRPTYFTYDALNREATRLNAFLDTWTNEYDARSSVLKRIDAEGRAAYFEYDLLGRQIHQANAMVPLEQTYFGYDARSSRVKITNPRDNSTTFTIDRLSRTTHQTDALNGVRYFGYDEVGNQLLGLDELGNPSYFTYDGLNRQTKAIDVTLAETYFGYDATGNVILRRDADARHTYYTYDGAQRMSRQIPFGPPAEATMYYAYDAVGNLTVVRDETGASINGYDRLDRPVTKTTLAGTVYYEYDKSGMKTRLKDPTLKASYYGYDVAGRLAHVQLLDGTQRAQYYEYDKAGLATKKASPQNRVLSYYTYDVAGRLKQLENKDSALAIISYFAYERDANGQITKTRREDEKHYYYRYDALDRLTDEIHTNTSGAVIYGWYYDYDAASNRKRKQETRVGDTIYYEYNSLNLLTKEFKLPAAGAQVTHYFTYDLSQRMGSDYTRSTDADEVVANYFNYNQRNMVAGLQNAVQTGSADSPRYFLYNGAAERVFSRLQSPTPVLTYWAFDRSKLLLEKNANEVTYFRHNQSGMDSRGSLMEIELSGGARGSPAFDERASVKRMKDGVGVNDTFEYDRFGILLPGATEGIDSTLRFWSPYLIREPMTEDYYLTKSGLLYVPRAGLLLQQAGDGQPIPLGEDEDERDGGDILPFGEDEFEPFGEDEFEPFGEDEELCTRQQIIEQGRGDVAGSLANAFGTGEQPEETSTLASITYEPTPILRRCCAEIRFVQIVRADAQHRLVGHDWKIDYVVTPPPPPTQPRPFYNPQWPWPGSDPALMTDVPGIPKALAALWELAGAEVLWQEWEACAVCIRPSRPEPRDLTLAILGCVTWGHRVNLHNFNVTQRYISAMARHETFGPLGNPILPREIGVAPSAAFLGLTNYRDYFR